MNQNRKGWLDLSRGFLMCLVYLYHAEVFYGTGHVWSWLFTPIFLTGFFFISGYLFTSDWEKVSIRKKMMQVVRAILIPYFMFMIVFFLPKIVLLHYDWKETAQNILLLRASWFVIAIGVLQMLYAITMKYVRNVGPFIIISLIYGLIGYGCLLFYRDLPTWFLENGLLYSKEMPGCMPACINLAFLSTPFFSLGVLYRKFEGQILPPPIGNCGVIGLLIAIVYCVLMIVDHRFWFTSFTYSSCLCTNFGLNIMYFIISMSALIMVCKKVDVIKPLNYIGENTLLFYYFNVLMLRVAGMFYDKGMELTHWNEVKGSLGYGNYIIVTLMAVIGTFPLVWFINKYLPFLAGRKDVYNKISRRLNLNINW